MAKKYKKLEVINAVIRLKIDEMYSTKSILDFLQNELKYGQTMAYHILKESRQAIEEYYKDMNMGSLEEAIGQMETIAETAKREKNLKLAFEVRKEMSKMLGHYTEKIELKGDLNHSVQVIKLNGPQDNERTTN